jgi:RimJ/RimL family protein N-acetyltransferase
MAALYPLTLEGRYVRLLPLEMTHAEALHAAASEARETYRYTLVPPTYEAMRSLIAELLVEAAQGLTVPFTTTDARTGAVLGATRFMSIETWRWPGPRVEPAPKGPDALEIGGTWLAASAQRTGVNTEAKYLMLRHAFEVLAVHRVTLKTDQRNTRSRNAIERIGGRFDGVLRAHMPAFDGGIRDTAFFSILRSEWPAVRERLQARMR